jgi:hypothetical protein
MMLLVWTSPSDIVCTSDLFARNDDGKAVGLETVTTVLDDVSVAG